MEIFFSVEDLDVPIPRRVKVVNQKPSDFLHHFADKEISERREGN